MRNKLRVRYDVHCMSDDETLCIVCDREFTCLADVQLAISHRLDDLSDQGVEHNWRQRHWWMDLRVHKGISSNCISVPTELKLCGEGTKPSFSLAYEDRYVALADDSVWHTAHGPGDFADAPGLIVTWLDLHLGTEAKVKVPLRPDSSVVETAPPTLLQTGGHHV